ncbi:MAG: peptidase [Gammaproteobacteria bacterium]|nr:peptidase [Gammaproteobacteria bacterium]
MKYLLSLGFLSLLASLSLQAHATPVIDAPRVIQHYAAIAHATFSDALTTAQTLDKAIHQLIAKPTAANLQTARLAWKAARIPYGQSEVFRFGNAIVDDWEGQINTWPLDEGMIDYVAGDYEFELGNEGAKANVIANTQLKIGAKIIDASIITPEILISLNELSGSEANIATGYHAIEFLLWGQDTHGTGSGAGERPASDYAKGNACTHGNCDRRGQFLQAASTLLVKDLQWMVNQWAPLQNNNYRAKLLAESSDQGLRKILYGMGTLALGELAGERTNVALEANSTEDEHDCFSDNTHNSLYFNAQGIKNIYTGTYIRIDGSVLKGPSLAELIASKDTKVADNLKQQLDNTQAALQKIVDSAEKNNMHFDQLIAADNIQGHVLLRNAIAALINTARAIEKGALTLGIKNINPDAR